MKTGQTIDALSRALGAGKTTSCALVEAALESIARDGGAFTHVAAERARAEADHSDRMRALGSVPSKLAGVPISVKDLFDVAGEATYAGSKIEVRAARETRDAPVIARLRAAGAIIVGRTHMSEFAFHGIGSNPHFPRCANPADTARVPGGSSSGAAVSVARGQVAMGLGTDTGGSTRVPAAFCGVVGYKPTQRRITRDDAVPLSETLDSIGPLAHSVACCAESDRIIADEATAVHPPVALRGLRLGVVQDLVLDGMDEHVARAFKRAVDVLSAAGARVEDVRVEAFKRIPEINAKGSIANAESFRYHSAMGFLGKRELYDPNVLTRIEIGGRMTAADYITILREREGVIQSFDRAFAPYDALVCPATAIVAPRFDEVVEPAAFTRLNGLALRNALLVNFIDGCALSLPMHRAGELPTGFMVVGKAMDDARLFAIGAAVEAALQAAA